MRAGLGVEAEGAESAEIPELRKTFAVEGVDRILGGWCFNSNHDVRLNLGEKVAEGRSLRVTRKS
jgi:hypothetical protein